MRARLDKQERLLVSFGGHPHRPLAEVLRDAADWLDRDKTIGVGAVEYTLVNEAHCLTLVLSIHTFLQWENRS